MKYQVLDTFRVKTSQGERELLPGQIISLSLGIAEKLLTTGRITNLDSEGKDIDELIGCTHDNLTCDHSKFSEKKGIRIRWVECLCPGAIRNSCPFQEGDWWEAHLKRKEQIWTKN